MRTDRRLHTTQTGEPGHGSQPRAGGWAWRWTGWASWPVTPGVLAVCALIVGLDVASSWWGQPEWHLGRVSLSPALPLGALLVVLMGPERLGFSRRSFRAWREFLLLGGAVVLVWCIAYPRSSASVRDLQGIVLAIAGEEIVYRLAALLLVGAMCARLAGRDWRDTASWGSGPAIGGLIGAGLVFNVLPGHVQQMTGAANLFPFLSLAVLLGYVALRSGSLIPGFLVHVAMDLTALAYFAGDLSSTMRVLVDLGALVGLVLGLMLAGRRLGLRRRVPRVIDLRESATVVPASA